MASDADGANDAPLASLVALLTEPVATLLSGAGDAMVAARVLVEAGVLRAFGTMRPDQAAGVLNAVRRWGMTPAAGIAANAARLPAAVAVIDDAGALTFAQLHRRTNALANGLAELGIDGGTTVGVLCRNHRYFVEAVGALSKLGATAVLLNTSFAGPQLAEALRAEGATALIHDAEFTPAATVAATPAATVAAAPAATVAAAPARVLADVDSGSDAGGSVPTLEGLIARASDAEPTPPSVPGDFVILTSGTTGRPKGIARGASGPTANAGPGFGVGVGPLVAVLERIPLRFRDTALISAPLFHAWGFGHLGLALVTASTVVLSGRFEAESTLAAIEQHRVAVLVAVPVMLQRIMELPESTRSAYDTSTLRVVASSGSTLPGGLATRFMDAYGDILYNLYGSTEVAWATIAGPADLRAAPGTAGFPPRGTTIRVVGEDDADVAVGEAGRIFVGNNLLFGGYRGGGGKEMLGELMSTGDLGHLDEAGRLFVDGRDDDMIVSGGENVFPQEVEELLGAHPAVADVAVLGVPDERFGHRLKALVVRRQGAELSAHEVREHVRSSLARYKVPRDVEFVAELPRTSTGKLLRRNLV